MSMGMGTLVPNSPVAIDPPSIADFCNAVREKGDWYHKILDRTRNLDLKWATEAGLVDSSTSITAEVAAALEELKNEAQRTVFVDWNIRVDNPIAFKEPDSSVDLESFDSDILSSLRYAALSPYGVRAPSNLSEEVGVFISDDLVPASLHRELVLYLDALAQREPLDLHPGSHGKVQDLIHPSLYPLVLGESPLDDTSKSSLLPSIYATEVTLGHETTELRSQYAWIPTLFNVSDDGKDVHIQSYINGLGPREHFPRLYRIVEKVFLLALPHFESTLGFEYKHDYSPSVYRWQERWLMRTEWGGKMRRSEWEKFLKDQAAKKHLENAQLEEMKRGIPKETDIASTDRLKFAIDDTNDGNVFPFKGRQLKVIVKAANYQLKAGQTYEGTWHMEGMPHEKIVASVIYYYDTDQAIIDQGLKFRKGREPAVDFPTIEDYRHESFTVSFRPEASESNDNDDYDSDYDSDDYEDDEDDGAKSDSTSDFPSDWDGSYTSSLGQYLELGTVPTTNFITNKTVGSESSGTGRILSFPNWIQHQVGKLSVAEQIAEDYVAKRKILCFFLVDDDDEEENESYHGVSFQGLKNQVLTSSDIPSQVRMTNIRTLRFLLPFICRHLTDQNLPPELVQRILDSAYWGFSREEAERHRRNLMKDRVILTDAATSRGGFSLCEH
ncbi:hypothetical protein FB451DRAFT_1373392 [Mycena latifolia]|nr:hypothetical protein FB451DRAFT_1373392 [Mycena latifolia]